MKWTVVIAGLVAALSSFSTAPVYANDLADVVRARANARAGGGTSGHDAWVLKRHGKLSGSGGSSRRALGKKKAAKKRALLAAKARKRAAAKHRAILAAKKKKAAQHRAYLLAKKKKEAAKKRAILLAKKKKEARKRALAAAKQKKAKLAAIAAKKKAKAQKLAAATDLNLENVSANGAITAETEKREQAFFTAPSTATLLTSHELAPASDASAGVPVPSNVAVVAPEGQPAETDDTVVNGAAQAVGSQGEEAGDNCKRFLPAIGLTISVGC